MYHSIKEFRVWAALPLCLVCASFCAGCAKVESRFVYDEATDKLLPEASLAVKASLQSTFGTPADPQIPGYFPVDRGGIVAEVEEVSTKDRMQLRIKLETPADENEQTQITAGQLIEFLFDPEDAFDIAADALEVKLPSPFDALSGLKVVSYDSENGLLKFDKPLPEIELIESGLQIVINPNYKLQQGSALYSKHCLHCHGVSGDGNGPTAIYMTPRPRDYRRGVFKFTSTGPQNKVSTADLKHLVIEGIPGTYMASFKMLPDEEVDLLVEYVKYLALRGVTERVIDIEVGIDFAQTVLEDELEDVEDADKRLEIMNEIREELAEFLESDYLEIDLFGMLDLADAWDESVGEGVLQSPSIARTDPDGPSAADPTKTSLENGRLLYLGNTAQCASCHGDAGKGDGFQTRQLQKKPDGSEYDLPGLYDSWSNPLKPRDLTRNIYRGGRRPIDVFRRIYCGIKGTPMPVYGGKGLSDEQIWDIVNYVMAIPFDEQKTEPAK
ncbi:MAG: cytochrome c [Planctomycetaceae bacterium]|nr:cytochrome c [Planctomycetaceae bacterium]MBL4886614.1 cytochrome c [Planctomycetaceae bacterium]